MDQPVPRPARNGRADFAVAEIELRALHGCAVAFEGGASAHDGRLIGANRFRRHLCGRAGLLGLHPGSNAPFPQFRVASGIRFGVLQLSPVARKVRLGLPQSSPIGPGIDLEEQISFADVRAFHESRIQQLAADLRLHFNGHERLNGADGLDLDRDSLFDRNSCADRNGGWSHRGLRPFRRGATHRHQKHTCSNQ